MGNRTDHDCCPVCTKFKTPNGRIPRQAPRVGKRQK
jgi:hypothetical protein